MPLRPGCEDPGVLWLAAAVDVATLGVALPATELSGWDDLDEACDGCDGGWGVAGAVVGVLVLDSEVGLGFARLREPIARIGGREEEGDDCRRICGEVVLFGATVVLICCRCPPDCGGVRGVLWSRQWHSGSGLVGIVGGGC